MVAGALGVLLPAGLGGRDAVPPPGAEAQAGTRPGAAAPARLVAEFETALVRAIRQFETKDLQGVLAHVSEDYRTGPMTKPAIRSQILAMFQIYDAVQARVAIDEVRLVGEHAWIFSTGQVQGRLPILGRWMTVLWWERELEVARQEDGVWRLYGYQR